MMAAKAISKTSLTNSPPRRDRAAIESICDALIGLLRVEYPMTVRQVFYRMVSAGVIDKTESEYKNTICRLLARMRKRGDIPFGWIADSTRWMRKPTTHSTLLAALDSTVKAYRRSVWDDQSAYVEMWLEKEALAGVLVEETEIWDVPLMVTRGYPSLSFLYSAAEQIAAIEKPAYLYYFGDYDPSGVDITRTVEKGIREFAPDAEIHFERVAVTPAQVEEFGLLTRPTKKTDSRSKNFEGESIEVDAIPPQTLRQMVKRCIEQHIDRAALTRLLHNEELERQSIHEVFDAWKEGRLSIQE
jgi:hypothetical protein